MNRPHNKNNPLNLKKIFIMFFSSFKSLKHKFFKPTLLAGIFCLLMTFIYYTGYFEYLKWSVWKEIHLDVKEYVSNNMLFSILVGILFYISSVLTFLPAMIFIDLIIGYLFPHYIATLMIMTGSTLSGLLIFFLSRHGFKRLFSSSNSKFLSTIKGKFEKNKTLYLLSLRFFPFSPFAFVSAALASLPISYKKMAWTTFIGMAPVAFILTGIGNSLERFMVMDNAPGLIDIIDPYILCSIILLSVICILPSFIRKKA